MLNVIDEFTRECLAIRVNRKLKAVDLIDVLSDLFILRGIPGQITAANSWLKQSGNGLQLWGPRRLTSSPAVHGKTAIARASTPSSGMNC